MIITQEIKDFFVFRELRIKRANNKFEEFKNNVNQTEKIKIHSINRINSEILPLIKYFFEKHIDENGWRDEDRDFYNLIDGVPMWRRFRCHSFSKVKVIDSEYRGDFKLKIHAKRFLNHFEPELVETLNKFCEKYNQLLEIVKIDEEISFKKHIKKPTEIFIKDWNSISIDEKEEHTFKIQISKETYHNKYGIVTNFRELSNEEKGFILDDDYYNCYIEVLEKGIEFHKRIFEKSEKIRADAFKLILKTKYGELLSVLKL